MAEGINVNFKVTSIVGGIIITLIGATGYGTSLITSGASEETTKDIQTIIKETVDEMDATMTLEEAETWRAQQDRAEHIDEAILEYGQEITSLQKDVATVQRTLDANTKTIRSIADKVGAE
jgi:hypothetical protein